MYVLNLFQFSRENYMYGNKKSNNFKASFKFNETLRRKSNFANTASYNYKNLRYNDVFLTEANGPASGALISRMKVYLHKGFLSRLFGLKKAS
jgi:hypothetical protein